MQNSFFKKWLSVLLVILGTLIGVGITENLPTNCGRSIQTGISARIMGGNDAKLGQWPWMAALYLWNSTKNGGSLCGGSVIAPEWVLTAAHCFCGNDWKILIVRLGDLDLDPNVPDGAHPIDMDHKALFIHPNFIRKEGAGYDIALVQLKNKVIFSKFISPVRLPFDAKFQSDKFYETKKPFIMGWGLKDETKKMITTRLQYAQIDVAKHDDCRRMFAQIDINISKEVICTGDFGKGACKGDSGGPLILLDQNIYYVVGVSSLAKKCTVKNPHNSVFTKVPTYLSWIRHVTGITM